MLFLIVCGWIVSGVLGYWLIRRDFIYHNFTWLNSDKVFWLMAGVIFGPILLITGIVLEVTNLLGKNNQGWFNRPSRW